MGEKCCTKKKNCDNTPKCAKDYDINKIIAYVAMMNFWIVVFRILLIKKEETASLSGSGPFGYLWWYTKFILFLQIQLFALFVFYKLTVSTYYSLITCLTSLIDSLTKFLGFVQPSPLMDWLGLSTFYWWCVKIWYFFVIIWYVVGFFVILGGYIFIVLLFGPYLLGYYKINAYKARGNSYF